MTSRWPHSRSWHTSISVFFPFTASIRFPHTGHFVLVRLSWRNKPSPVLIWRISSCEYPLMSFMNAPLFRLPFAMPDSFISQSAVSSGFFRSSGTSSRSCLALDVRQISLPRFSSRKLENSFSIISALVATVPRPPVSPRVFAMALSFVSMYATGFSMAESRVASLNGAGGFVLPSVILRDRPCNTSPFFRSGSCWSFTSGSSSSSPSSTAVS